MITLLATISGFLGSILPECIKFLRDKTDKKHELDILDRQIQYSQLRSNQRLEEIYISRDIANSLALTNTYNTGIIWVDAFNGTVRPLLAYSFFILYAVIKYTEYKALGGDFSLNQLYSIWNIDDQAIFASIISFYFGQRTFNKAMGRKNA
jgi:hypothetical protein